LQNQKESIMHKKLFVSALSLLLLAPLGLLAHSNMYFASPYRFGTRFERKGLITIDTWGAHGNTKNGRDGNAKKTNILNIYGFEKMHQLGKNVSGQDITSTSVDVLNALWRNTPTTNDANYATLQFTGKCCYSGGGASFAINLTDEFFFGGEIPFYRIDMKDPTFVDKTPDADKDAEWNQFYALFDSILADVGLSRLGIKKSGIGDISFFAGWTRSTEELDNLDFLDATLRVGALFGTADAKDEDFAFSIAPGYDKHNGVFFGFDMAFGFAKHCSFGFHLNELFLFQKSKNMRIKSALGQNGFIKLAKANVKRDMGNIYEVGGHFKVDYETASFYAGYTYAHKGSDSLTAKNSTLYPGSTLNSDEMLKGWSTHTVHIGAEVDFANENKRNFHPKFGISYNHVVRARRAFENSTVVGSLGISITCEI
jgi:hypothetical protein